jgi:hypothetical protein
MNEKLPDMISYIVHDIVRCIKVNTDYEKKNKTIQTSNFN